MNTEHPCEKVDHTQKDFFLKGYLWVVLVVMGYAGSTAWWYCSGTILWISLSALFSTVVGSIILAQEAGRRFRTVKDPDSGQITFCFDPTLPYGTIGWGLTVVGILTSGLLDIFVGV